MTKNLWNDTAPGEFIYSRMKFWDKPNNLWDLIFMYNHQRIWAKGSTATEQSHKKIKWNKQQKKFQKGSNPIIMWGSRGWVVSAQDIEVCWHLGARTAMWECTETTMLQMYKRIKEMHQYGLFQMKGRRCWLGTRGVYAAVTQREWKDHSMRLGFSQGAAMPCNGLDGGMHESHLRWCIWKWDPCMAV